MSRNVGVETVTISTGAAGVSNVINLEGKVVFGAHMSTGWTAAPLTFLASPTTSTGTMQDVYDDAGTEVSVTVAASRYVGITGSKADALGAVDHLMIRSGDTSTAVAQAASRTLYLLTKG
jgi:hypothetical protein